MFNFEILNKQSGSQARTGVLKTNGATIQTPELAIVATDAQLRSLPNEALKDLSSRYFIVNTYHTYTKKIIPSVEKAGGIHQYMSIPGKLVATDSGGFQ